MVSAVNPYLTTIRICAIAPEMPIFTADLQS